MPHWWEVITLDIINKDNEQKLLDIARYTRALVYHNLGKELYDAVWERREQLKKEVINS